MLTLLVFRLLLSKHNYLIYKNKQYKSRNLKLVKHKLSKILNIVKFTECSRNLEFEKRTDQNVITQNIRDRKKYCIWKTKKLLKQCLKEVIYEYTLAFAGWSSILWEMVGSGGYILAGGGWLWIYFGWWWKVVDGGGWW